MRSKFFLLIPMFCCLLVFSSCVDTKTTKNLYDDWWPIHASGSFSSEYFKASWDGDLNKHGGIEVTYQSTTNPALNYKEDIYYPALKFSKKQKGFCYISLKDLLNITASKYLKFYVKDGQVFLEKVNDAGRGTGEYQEGKTVTFQGDDIVKIGDVTYQRYSAYRQAHKLSTSSDDLAPGDEIPIKVYL